MPTTAADRRSAAGVPFLPLGPGVTPDAAQPVAWRQQAGWGYSGVSAADTAPTYARVTTIPAADRSRTTVPADLTT